MKQKPMTIEQFERAVNTLGYAVIASYFERAIGTEAEVPPFEDGRRTSQRFVYARVGTYDETAAYTSAAYGKDTRDRSLTNEEWRRRQWPTIPYIILTD